MIRALLAISDAQLMTMMNGWYASLWSISTGACVKTAIWFIHAPYAPYDSYTWGTRCQLQVWCITIRLQWWAFSMGNSTGEMPAKQDGWHEVSNLRHLPINLDLIFSSAWLTDKCGCSYVEPYTHLWIYKCHLNCAHRLPSTSLQLRRTLTQIAPELS